MERHTLDVWSPQLRNRRPVDVYLPDSYSAGGRRRYAVVYMHDGQNLSDPALAFGGNTWQLPDTLGQLAARGVEPIVVGIHNTGDKRLGEYSPYPDPQHGGGKGDRYLRFLLSTLKPRIEARYRTRAGAASTAILGSSMGGLITAFAFAQPGSPFGAAAIMSPSIWFGARRILDAVRATRRRGRVYLDVGTEEGADTLRDARDMAALLREKGYGDALRYVEAQGHRHQERDWAARLPAALEFLLEH